MDIISLVVQRRKGQIIILVFLFQLSELIRDIGRNVRRRIAGLLRKAEEHPVVPVDLSISLRIIVGISHRRHIREANRIHSVDSHIK